jgi:hypothetical protein
MKRDFAADRALIDPATAGPWAVRSSYYGGMRYNVYDARTTRFDLRLHNEPDARFIAEARTGWPAALDEIRRLRSGLISIVGTHMTAEDAYMIALSTLYPDGNEGDAE